MSQRSPRTVAISATPLSRHGLLTTADLRKTGLTQGAIWSRVNRGALYRRYHGVYSLSPGELSPEGEWTAALLAAGEGAVLSHLSAATLWKAWRYREEVIDVLVPRRHVPIPGVRLRQCRSLHPLDVYVYKGIPVTTVARMLVDLTDILIADELTNVIKEAAFRERFSLDATRRAMARANGRHNLDVLEQALEFYERGSAGTRSRAEVAFLKHSDLPRPLVNTKHLDIEIDLQWPDRKLAVEIDGPGHDRPSTKREDALKVRVLEAEGWTVLRFASEEVEQHPERVMAKVRPHLGL